MSESKLSADCYSAIDRKMMIWFQDLRARSLKPFLAKISQCHINADRVSALSLIFGLVAALSFQWSPLIAFILLTIHVLLDGLDGPLARFQKKESAGGSFMDSCCDQFVIAITTFAFVKMGILDATLAGIYVFFYTIVVAFSMIRNSIQIPYPFLIRPRFFVYIAALIEIFFYPQVFNIVVAGFTLILLYHMLTGFFSLRSYLKGKKDQSDTL